MVLCGLVNKEIAALVKQAGARAVGICGKASKRGGLYVCMCVCGCE